MTLALVAGADDRQLAAVVAHSHDRGAVSENICLWAGESHDLACHSIKHLAGTDLLG